MKSETRLSGFLGLLVLLVFLLSSSVTLVDAKISNINKNDQKYKEAKSDAMGVCPPFNLLDEKGNIIDPTRDLNSHVPYSPKKTCGRCHNYAKITQGYHFQQGKDEKMTKDFHTTYPWCTSPGQYGGRW